MHGDEGDGYQARSASVGGFDEAPLLDTPKSVSVISQQVIEQTAATTLERADETERTQPVPAKRLRRLATVRCEDEVETVLATMQDSGRHVARVVGEDGETRGVVFLEDVIEELVGEVSDTTQRAR